MEHDIARWEMEQYKRWRKDNPHKVDSYAEHLHKEISDKR